MTDATHAHPPGAGHDAPQSNDAARDPVCGMTVNPATTPHRHVHHGESYFFCSGGCRTKFAANPGAYLDPPPGRLRRYRRARRSPARCTPK